ncbi:hypothetical protein TRFO_26233 [Tritrichomonas foetus]|uniref:Cilia- and flagella-associated protein 52 n=1 Tax=Tritrichomonas foetus TaxID=1144522 RepID=A0A1J4K3D0_9EUKA|nr:hypothetical protein TRFO_26233 [Tritrichomonas foetus]|eukprot:OHT05879.1 hypothetical protein TRFO_26233 [Tritrichomonas foetus]
MSSPISFLTSTPMPVEWIDSNHYVTAVGCNIVIASISNPDQYEFLEGHSQEITTFAVDKNKTIIVSGQCGKESHTETSTPVIVWDIQSRSQIIVLRGHKSAIKNIAISEDSRIVAVTDQTTNKIWIWDLREQDLGCFLQPPKPASSIVFGGCLKDSWLLHVTYDKYLMEYTIKFDVRTFEYKSEEKQYANPTNGYKRTYDTSSFVFPFLFVGTKAGELAVYHAASATLRANLPVDSFSVSAITDGPDEGTVLVGGHDLSILRGNDKDWTVVKTMHLDCPIATISRLDNRALVRCIDTSIQLIDLRRMSRQTIYTGIVNRPLCCAATNETVVVGLGENGLTIAYIERGGRLTFSEYRPEFKATAVAATPVGDFVIGCSDGTLAEIDGRGIELWRTERVHRGKITAICATADFIATGGADGMIRIVTHKSRTLINEIMVHNAQVYKIIPAFGHPQQIHSVSADRTMTTTDISTGKRICQQLTADRIAFTSIDQLTDGETEILVSMGDGKVRAYDWPRKGIIFELDSPQALQINSIALKPKSRFLACGGESEYLSFCDVKDECGEWSVGGTGHSLPIRCVTWTSDGKYLLSAADDGLCIWKV